MRYLKAIYIGDVEHSDGRLNLWMNPESKKVVAIVNMDVDASRNFINDPYDDEVRLVFHDTFSGLPK